MDVMKIGEVYFCDNGRTLSGITAWLNKLGK